VKDDPPKEVLSTVNTQKKKGRIRSAQVVESLSAEKNIDHTRFKKKKSR